MPMTEELRKIIDADPDLKETIERNAEMKRYLEGRPTVPQGKSEVFQVNADGQIVSAIIHSVDAKEWIACKETPWFRTELEARQHAEAKAKEVKEKKKAKDSKDDEK